jgi:hypothetical protein
VWRVLASSCSSDLSTMAQLFAVSPCIGCKLCCATGSQSLVHVALLWVALPLLWSAALC